MKKRILFTLILSLLVLTACSSETPNASPDEITPIKIVRTQAAKTVSKTVATTEEPTEVETVVAKTKTEQKVEVKIVEQVEESKAPAPTQKPTQKPTEKAKPEVEKIEPQQSGNEQDIQNMVS